MANHSSPGSCGVDCEVCGEALTGDTGRRAIEPRNNEIGMPTLSIEAEGNMGHGAKRKSCHDPAQ